MAAYNMTRGPSRRSRAIDYSRRVYAMKSPQYSSATTKRRRNSVPHRAVISKTELKFLDTADGPEQIALTGEIFENSANLVAQGDAANERVGAVIYVHDLLIDFMLKLPNTATESSQADVVKLLVYLDKRTNGATPALADFYDVIPAANIGFLSHRNVRKSHRFRILHESNHHMNPTAGGGNGSAATDNIQYFKHVKVRLHFKTPIRIDYDDGTAAIGVVNGNNIGIYCCNHIGVITVQANTRIRFTD